MNLRHLTAAMLFAGVAVVLFGIRTTSASPSMIATCSPATGLNIASDIERDQPKGSVPEVYDPEAKAYVSHPRNTNTESTIITVNTDGTATQTSFSEHGTSLVTNMRILGTINANAISMIDDGPFFDLLTLYPKESIAVFAGTSYTGWKKAIPTGYVYISHCKFSNVIN